VREPREPPEPLLTGFCDSGWHEGNKIDKPTCRFWVTCPCECHTQISRIAALTETERTMIDNSTWTADRNLFVRVSLTESIKTAALSKPNMTFVPSEIPGIMPDSYIREFSPTASGRTQRGQLEAWVLEATQRWMSLRLEGQEVPACTPQWLADQIYHTGKVTSLPSTGAIDAVFRRWVAIGYAVTGTKPTRFISFTPAGVKDGLEVMKARARR
jgi:hypothetical protein